MKRVHSHVEAVLNPPEPVQPELEAVVLNLTVEDAIAVCAKIGTAPSRGAVPSTFMVYSRLHDILRDHGYEDEFRQVTRAIREASRVR